MIEDRFGSETATESEVDPQLESAALTIISELDNQGLDSTEDKLERLGTLLKMSKEAQSNLEWLISSGIPGQDDIEKSLKQIAQYQLTVGYAMGLLS